MYIISIYNIGYTYESKLCKTKVLWVFKFDEVGHSISTKSKSLYVNVFSVYFCQSVFFLLHYPSLGSKGMRQLELVFGYDIFMFEQAAVQTENE